MQRQKNFSDAIFVGKASQKAVFPEKLLAEGGCGPPTARHCAERGAWATAGSLGVWEDGGPWTIVAPLTPPLH